MCELKPCPFCGSTDVAANSYSIEASVRCFGCFAVIVRKHPKYSDGGLVAAITAWNTRADLSDALLREAMEALGGVMAACDHGRMVATTGVGGMTIEANIRGSVYMGVPAWPIEEARATLAKLRSHMGGNHE